MIIFIISLLLPSLFIENVRKRKLNDVRQCRHKVHNDDAPKNCQDKCMRWQMILSDYPKQPQPMNLIEWIKFNVNYHNYVIFLEFFILSTREQLHFLKVSPECWWTKHSGCCWFHMKMQRIPCGNAVLPATLFKSDESVSHFQ